jgi:hypothetical protein
MDKFYKHAIELTDAIQDCLAKRRILPCLTLLYSGIDVIASLEAKSSESTQDSFVRWVETYMLKNGSFSCTALDLYAARCGILHTFTPESRLRRSGRARFISYAWGGASASKLEQAGKLLGEEYPAVQIEDLIHAFRSGVANQFEEVCNDPQRERQFEKSVARWFGTLDHTIVDAFLTKGE